MRYLLIQIHPLPCLPSGRLPSPKKRVLMRLINLYSGLIKKNKDKKSFPFGEGFRIGLKIFNQLI
jgi:hypothetical protein